MADIHSESLYGERYLPIEPISSVIQNFTEGRSVRCAGRMMARRIMGKSVFCDLKDEDGRIQMYGKSDELGEPEFEAFKALRIGDILGVEGTLFNSKTGEKTIKV